MVLTGGALERLRALTPPGMVARIDLTITDEPPMAQALVIISAIPETVNLVPAPGVRGGRPEREQA